MSCNRNGTRAGRTAGLRSGIGYLSGQATHVAAMIADKAGSTADAVNNTVNRAVAPLSNRVLAAVDRPAVTAGKVLPALLAAAAVAQGRIYLGPGPNRTPTAGVMVALRPRQEIAQNMVPVRTGQQLLRYAGLVGMGISLAAGLTHDEKTAHTLELKQNGQRLATVSFWKSDRLTRFLNRRHLLGSHVRGKNLVSDEGELVAAAGGTWHWGASVVETPQGRRIITHVQRLGLPAASSYFDRSLSEIEVAGLVAGHLKAPRLAGYVGEISAMEHLAPVWAATKRALIINRLYWPSPRPEWTPQKKQVSQEDQQPVAIRPVKPDIREQAYELPDRV